MSVAQRLPYRLPKLKRIKPSTKGLNFRQAASTIYSTEGFNGFLRGLTPSLIKNSTMTGQYFSILFYLEVLIRRLNMVNLSDSKVQLLAGGGAKAMQSVLANPLIVIKTRLEVIGFNEYHGFDDAIRKIYKKEGLKGFFTGLRISLIRDVPFAGMFYPIYSFFRQKLTAKFLTSDKNYTKSERIKRIAFISTISSFAANTVSCVLTHPLDLIRTREICKIYNHDKN